MRHTKQVEIRWSDVDAFGHVNHTRFATYFEEARDEWADRAAGSWDGVMEFVIRRIEIDYLSQLTQRDDYVLATIALDRIGTTSLVTREEMHAGSDGRLVARGTCVLVHVDAALAGASPIPEAIRVRLDRASS